MIISNSFTPFFGFVEDINDPTKNGRVRVRVTGYHTQNKGVLATDDLIWYTCLVNNSESEKGIGTNPKYNVGSMVFGYFIDNQLQNGFIVGSFNGMPNGENDINRLARNEEIDQTIVQKKKDSVRTGVEKTSGSWDEPQTPYNAKYPDNKVTETNSGHVTESDDTEGAERLHVYHKAGSFYEIHPDGSQVVKIVKDNYTIIAGDGYFCIEGDASGFVGGSNDLVIKGNNDVKIDGTNTIDVEGKSTLRAPNIQLGEDSNVEPSVLGDKLAAWIMTELVPWLNTHNHIGNLGFPTSPAATGSLGPFDPGTGAKGGAVYSKRNTNQ